MREHYGQVEILGYYDSPEDYVSGNLASSKFEIFEEEKPFDGGMNIQYNMDRSGNETLMKETGVLLKVLSNCLYAGDRP